VVNNKVSNKGWDVRNIDNGFKATRKTTRKARFLRNLDEIK